MEIMSSVDRGVLVGIEIREYNVGYVYVGDNSTTRYWDSNYECQVVYMSKAI